MNRHRGLFLGTALLGMLGIACSAGAQVLDFQQLEHNDGLTRDEGTVVIENGFQVTKGQNEAFNFATFGTQETRYPGSTALFNNTVNGVVKISAIDGHSFNVVSIDFANLNSPGSVAIHLVGNKTGGGQVTQTINHSDPDGILPLDLVTYPLTGFNNLDSIEWLQESPYHQFDNVRITGGIEISGYDITDAARSGFGGWGHAYNGIIADTGNFTANGFAFTRANYRSGCGTLNDGSEGTGTADTELFANNANARPRITLRLNGDFKVKGITLYSFDSGNTIPGTIRGCDVTIGGQTFSFSTTEPTPNDEFIDLTGSPLGNIATRQVILSNFIHDGSNGLNEMFCIGEIGLRGVSSGCTIDQNQPSATVYMAGFGQTDLAQSFQHPTSRNICGAGIKLQPNIGTTDTVRISLWDRLPNNGGTMLATGSVQGSAGCWVDVFWNPVTITPNTTYFLVFDGNTTLGISGDTSNPYPRGQVYANPGYQPFPNFDYTFRTYSNPIPQGINLTVTGTCPGTVTVRWTNAQPNATVALIFAKNTGSFIIPFGPCQGTRLGLGNNQIQLVNTFPSGSQGSGSRTGPVGNAACRGYLQMHDIPNCTLSNVAQLP